MIKGAVVLALYCAALISVGVTVWKEVREIVRRNNH